MPEILVHQNSTIMRLTVDSRWEPIVSEARAETASFFSNCRPGHPFEGPLAWAFYDRFFQDLALPYTRYQSLLEKCRNATFVEGADLPNELSNLLRAFCFHSEIPLALKSQNKSRMSFLKNLGEIFWSCFLILFSFFSLLHLWLFPEKKRIAVWTGDYLSSSGNLDPRLGDLEPKMKTENFRTVPFIRSTGVSPKKSFHNFFKRKGPRIYYEHVNSLFELFLASGPEKKGSTFFETAFYQMYSKKALSLKRQIRFWEKVFQALRFQAFISWFLSSRTASLLWGAKKANIPTIGFMHGVSVITFMGHEFIPEYNGAPIGTDYFGTFSDWWKNYFLENSSIYPQEGIQTSGPLKQLKQPSVSVPPIKTKNDCIQIYIIAETHLPVDELAPYLERLAQNPKFKIIFKIRPFGVDQFWTRLVQHPIYHKHQFQKSSLPTPACFADADVVIGTHSTALLETLVLNKPILLLNTKKWGDYFGMQSHFNGNCPFWVNSPDEIEDKIEKVLAPENKKIWKDLYDRFFGSQSGTDWILEKLRNLV